MEESGRDDNAQSDITLESSRTVNHEVLDRQANEEIPEADEVQDTNAPPLIHIHDATVVESQTQDIPALMGNSIMYSVNNLIVQDPLECSNNMEVPHTSSRRISLNWYQRILVIFIALTSMVVIGTMILRGKRSSSDEKNNNIHLQNIPPSGSSFKSEKELLLHLHSIFSEFSSPMSFLNSDSPQSQAIFWLVQEQEPNLYLWFVDQDDSITSRVLQRYALIVLSYACSGDKWRGGKTWMTQGEIHECDWTFVNCNDDMQVTHLRLDNLYMTGSLPEEIGLLSNMKRFDVALNRLEGSFPLSVFHKCHKLISLSLASNNFAFSIPTEIGLLGSTLRHLSLFMNPITGSLPQELKLLTSLEYLDLTLTQVEGDIFEFVSYWPNLNDLYVGKSKLHGSFPTNLHHQVKKLSNLDLRNVKGILSIPTTIGLLTNLLSLRFGDTLEASITGTLPSQLANLRNLQTLFVQKTDITGSLPTEIGSLQKLQVLILNNNKLFGSIPTELGNMTNMKQLILTFNDFSSYLPSTMSKLQKLVSLEIQGNNLNVPDEICDLPNLQNLLRFCAQECTCCSKQSSRGFQCV